MSVQKQGLTESSRSEWRFNAAIASKLRQTKDFRGEDFLNQQDYCFIKVADYSMASFFKPLLAQPGEHELRNERTGAVVATHLVGAFDSASRRTGLLHHKSFPEGHGLVIAPTNAVHTF